VIAATCVAPVLPAGPSAGPKPASGAAPAAAPTAAPNPEAELVARLRARDEAAFVVLTTSWHAAMSRVARAHVRTQASADEVVQETWLAVLHGLDRFEGRSSLKTWVYRILLNIARTRGVLESRTLPFSSADSGDDVAGRAVGGHRFAGADEEWAGHWRVGSAPQRWDTCPEGVLLNDELRSKLRAAMDALPERQRVVLVLRDVQGLSASDVCDLLGVSAENQRVLLHRARSSMRGHLEGYYRRGRSTAHTG
jgi:RNA polymerase sigma-70 factor (ECF subfamily)